MSATISKKILENMNNGMTLEAAINAVLGDGAFARIASDLYDALRAKK